MKIVAPDYYPSFCCIADKCRHSCCVGWEIDVDSDTLSYYKNIGGVFGKRLSESIDEENGEAHFILDENERCPFLNSTGLCDVITCLGENSLCQICADHPRFRDYYSDRVEIGLGLCCEAAAKLILGTKHKVKLVTFEDDGEREELCKNEKDFLSVRKKIFEKITRREKSLDERIDDIMKLFKASYCRKTPKEQAQLYMSLEKLDKNRDDVLIRLMNLKEDAYTQAYLEKFETAFEQLLSYLIYRHLPGAIDDGKLLQRLIFAADSTCFVKNLCAVKYNENYALTLDDIAEAARFFSSEIEYSEENLNKCIDDCAKRSISFETFFI